MTEEILKAVANSLPSMQMEALRKELEEAKKVPSLQREVEVARKESQQRWHELQCHKGLDQRQEELNKKEQQLKDREFKLDMELLKKDLWCAQQIYQAQAGFMNQVFRNAEFRKNMTGSAPQAGQYGGTIAINESQLTTQE